MKIRKMILPVVLTASVLFASMTAFALDTTWSDMKVTGTVRYSTVSVSGTMTVTNPYGASDKLTCKIYGYAYNGANSVIGSYSASNTSRNSNSVSCGGSGSVLVQPAYARGFYVYSGMTWTDTV